MPRAAIGDEATGQGYIDVPTQDLRAIRRAVLDLDEFSASREPHEM
jgi:hypothetical protein